MDPWGAAAAGTPYPDPNQGLGAAASRDQPPEDATPGSPGCRGCLKIPEEPYGAEEKSLCKAAAQ